MRILCLSIIVLLSLNLFAQRRVLIPEGFGTLNEAIRNDTIANGERKDPNTIYVLKRGGVYVLSGTVLATGFTLRLEAQGESGPRPYVLMGFLAGGTQVEECFSVFNGGSFKSIHFSAIDEVNTYVARILSVDAPDSRLEFYDCIMDGSGQTLLRLNSAGAKVYMRNCTVSRMGRPSNPDNGRIIDDRGNQVDSIVVENNTWYNVTSRVIRDGGGEVNYVKLNQNTFVNVGQRFAAVGAVNQFYFNNNIIVNPRYEGNSTTSTTVALEFSPTGSNPIINLDFNNIYYEQPILDAWVEISVSGNTRIVPPFVSPANQVVFDNAVGILEDPMNFTNGPVSPSEIVLESSLGSGSTVPDWDMTGAIQTNPWELDAIGYHNFSYGTSEASYAGSATGEPLGDLRWFPGFEIAWNLSELIKDAQQSIQEYENSGGILGGGDPFLAALESELAEAMLVTSNVAANRATTASAYVELLEAINTFEGAFIITEVEDEIKNLVQIFPNPATDFIYIANTKDQIDFLAVCDLSGKKMIENPIQQAVHAVDVRSLPAGLYIITLAKNNRKVANLKLIKK
jgi:Secretion system C-terminal sorting domain